MVCVCVHYHNIKYCMCIHVHVGICSPEIVCVCAYVYNSPGFFLHGVASGVRA